MMTLIEALERAFCDIESGAYATADSLCQLIVRQFPNQAEGWRLLARARLGLGSPREALDCLERARGLTPGDPVLLAEIMAIAPAVQAPDIATGTAIRAGIAPAPSSITQTWIMDRMNALPGALLENAQRHLMEYLNRVYPPAGLNLGGGNWSFPFFLNVDNLWGEGRGKITLDGNTRLPLGDGAPEYVFTSHFLEHVDLDTAAHLLREAHRTLKPGGILRVAVPDVEEAMRRYRAGDEGWFRFWVDPDNTVFWPELGIEPNLESKLLFVFALYNVQHVPGRWLAVPPAAGREEVRRRALDGDIDSFGQWAVSLIPPAAPERVLREHVNWYSWPRLEKLLTDTGFRFAERSLYRQSRAPLLRDAAFDNRPDITLYAEAWR